MQMYKRCVLANFCLARTPGQHLKGVTSLVLPSGSPHRPRKQATRAQYACSASGSGGFDALLQRNAHEKQRYSSIARGSLDAPQLLQAQQYMELLMTQNAKMNLTGDLPGDHCSQLSSQAA